MAIITPPERVEFKMSSIDIWFHIFDAGASTTIHAFGAYFGLAVSWMLSKKIKPRKKAERSSSSHKIAMIGTFFLWIFWPSFNFGTSANNIYDQNFIVANTYYSLTGSCLSTYTFLKKRSKVFRSKR